jgi:FkbM family methyltransferase
VTSSDKTAPVALFAYRRPAHLAQTLKSLRANPECSSTELFVFSDGAKSLADATAVEAVRGTLHRVEGFADVQIVCREVNFGLARNITEGVASVLTRRDNIIVLEDDIVVSPFFLQFMNDALAAYRDVSRVGSISGYCYPVTHPLPETYFIRGADCWSWATWRDRWRYFNPNSKALVANLESRGLVHSFDMDSTFDYFKMLKDHSAGKNDSWAVRWHASCFLNDLLILYPGRALARNIGYDLTGTHSSPDDATFDVSLSSTPVKVGGIPVEECDQAREAIKRLFAEKRSADLSRATSSGESRPTKSAPTLRHLIKSILPPRVVDRLRRMHQGARNYRSDGLPDSASSDELGAPAARRYWGLNDIDRRLEKYLSFDDGFFVELGANDGRFQSNTLYFERVRNWKGVLVEPAPNLFLKCRKNRSPRNYIVCAACVPFDYKAEFVKILYSNAMSVSLDLESDIADPAAHAELGRQFLQPSETLFTFGAVAATLDSILRNAKAPALIDLLSLDVEGSEVEVLKGVDYDAYRFRYMLIESRSPSKLRDYLESRQYRLIEMLSEQDYLFADMRCSSWDHEPAASSWAPD